MAGRKDHGRTDKRDCRNSDVNWEMVICDIGVLPTLHKNWMNEKSTIQ